MTLVAKVVRHAYRMGYRVLTDGQVYHCKRNTYRKTMLTATGRTIYARFTVKYRGRAVTIPVHRLGGYCKFGERALRKGVMVRHHDGNSLNNRSDNYLLGNNRSNMLDLGHDHLSCIAKRANARKKLRKAS